MKAKVFSVLLVVTAWLGMSFTTGNDPLEIGKSTPAFLETVTDLDGNNAPLRSYARRNGIMVIFSSNTCPFVKAWEDRYYQLAEYCMANDIGFVLVNSNEAKRDADDSFQAMKAHAKEMNYSFPYVVDHHSRIANMMGAKTTPHVFFFDTNLELVYRGAIDDNHKDIDKVNETYALNALRNHLAGVAVNPATTNALGCSIKRVKK